MFQRSENDILIICIYADDIIYMGSSQYLIDEFKLSMMSKFDMTNLGILYYFMGLYVYQGDHDIFISQKKYIMDMLKKFNMLKCKIVSTPIILSKKMCINDGTLKIDEPFLIRTVGRLMYLTHIRPHVMFM